MIVAISLKNHELVRSPVPAVDEPEGKKRTPTPLAGWGLLHVSRVDNDVVVSVYPTKPRITRDGKIVPVAVCRLNPGMPETRKGVLKRGWFGWRGRVSVELKDVSGVVR